MKKILVLGGNGMLGHMLCKVLAECDDFEVITTVRYSEIPLPVTTVRNINAYDPRRSLSKIVRKIGDFDIIINAIGVVKQREKLTNYDYTAINATFPHILAETCSQLRIKLIHISTDCVFSGVTGMYNEQDAVSPVDAYGASKLLGEVVDNPNVLTLRTSLIGWEIAHYWGLLSWFAKQRGKKISGYTNAIFSGFSTSAFARIITNIINKQPKLHGVYHVASEPISKYDLLERLRIALEWDVDIKAVRMQSVDRSLDAARFMEETGIEIPSWDDMIADLANDFENYRYDERKEINNE